MKTSYSHSTQIWAVVNVVLLQQKFCIVCTQVANHFFLSMSVLYSIESNQQHVNEVLHHFSYPFWYDKNAIILHHCSHALESLFSYIYTLGKICDRLFECSKGNIWIFVSFILPQNWTVYEGKQRPVRICRTWRIVALIAWIWSSEKYSLYLL